MTSETFEFERLYQIELDRVYKELGYEIIKRIQTKENRDFDLTLKKNGKELNIEEKGAQYYHPDCIIELIQDIYPLDLGWFYKTKASHIHYFYYQDLRPIVLYQIYMGKMRKELPGFFKLEGWEKKITPRFSIINYGITLNLCIKWKFLIEARCAHELKRWAQSNC